MPRIALNGLGRIGKLLLRHLASRSAFDDVVLLNDACGDAALHAHLLAFDTVHGRWDADIEHVGGELVIAGHPLPLCHERSIAALPLGDRGIDLVVDCIGAFRSIDRPAIFDGRALPSTA